MKLRKGLIGLFVAIPIAAYAIMAGAFAQGEGIASDGANLEAEFSFRVEGDRPSGNLGAAITSNGDLKYKLDMPDITNLNVERGIASFDGTGYAQFPDGRIIKGTIEVTASDNGRENDHIVLRFFRGPIGPGGPAIHLLFSGSVKSGDIEVGEGQ